MGLVLRSWTLSVYLAICKWPFTPEQFLRWDSYHVGSPGCRIESYCRGSLGSRDNISESITISRVREDGGLRIMVEWGGVTGFWLHSAGRVRGISWQAVSGMWEKTVKGNFKILGFSNWKDCVVMNGDGGFMWGANLGLRRGELGIWVFF